jgi:hypothetical protein
MGLKGPGSIVRKNTQFEFFSKYCLFSIVRMHNRPKVSTFLKLVIKVNVDLPIINDYLFFEVNTRFNFYWPIINANLLIGVKTSRSYAFIISVSDDWGGLNEAPWPWPPLYIIYCINWTTSDDLIFYFVNQSKFISCIINTVLSKFNGLSKNYIFELNI